MITEKINLAERHFSTLLKDFTAFATGLQSLQEKGMKLSKSIDIYSDEEYPSMKASLAGISESIAAIQDYLGAQVTVNVWFNRDRKYSYLTQRRDGV